MTPALTLKLQVRDVVVRALAGKTDREDSDGSNSEDSWLCPQEVVDCLDASIPIVVTHT